MKIMIGINTLTSIDRLAYANHLQVMFRFGRNHPEIEFALNTPNRMTIDRMRNVTAKIALENNFDYVLFIDDDVLLPFFECDPLQRLLNCKADIAAGWTIIRGYPFDNMFFKYNDDKTQLNKFNDFAGTEDEHGIVECDAVGFSLALIKCDLLRKMAPPYFVTGTYNTEDVYFCVNAKQQYPDVRIVVDTKIRTAHILGSELIEPSNREAYKRYYEEIYPQEKKEAEEKTTEGRADKYLNMVKNPTDKEAVDAFRTSGK